MQGNPMLLYYIKGYKTARPCFTKTQEIVSDFFVWSFLITTAKWVYVISSIRI
jgi:hypothetical protein